MIFQHTWEKVLSGEKTQSRRLVKPKEILSHYMTDQNPHWQPCVLHHAGGSTKWYAGHTYAVQPGRGKSTLWWKILDGVLCVNPAIEWKPTDTLDGYDYEDMRRFDNRATWRKHGYIEGRIRLTDIRREDVRCIRADDVSAEGFESCNDFWETWCKMHDPKATGDNPAYMEWVEANGFDFNVQKWLMSRPAERYQAWALTFELVKGQS